MVAIKPKTMKGYWARVIACGVLLAVIAIFCLFSDFNNIVLIIALLVVMAAYAWLVYQLPNRTR